MVCPSQPYHPKFFKGCLPQILLDPFLNTLTHFCNDRRLNTDPIMIMNQLNIPITSDVTGLEAYLEPSLTK